ncbi:hypothetical protein F5Y19DRAFT_423436 [Xylariaceae sp. FL1651]|nr:hypothetical protein F5Y19DRAFT_423436 [Xylariaceae sp. FL1651]
MTSPANPVPMVHSPPDDRAAPADKNVTSTRSSPAQPTHLRSCVLCRQRKVKCDRRQPCSNCTRAGTTCVHPPGAGRAAKRPRQNQAIDAKILDRLSQLEATIRRLQQETKELEADSHATSKASSHHASSRPSQARDSGDLTTDASPTTTVNEELGRLVVEESQSRYVSNVMWADLTESIEQLRGMFLDPNPKDDDSSKLEDSPPYYDEESPIPGSLGTNAAILGYRSLAHSLQEYHPPLELSMALFQIFNDNVLPVVRIFHTATLTRLFWEAVVATDSLDKETEALLFAIYYSAIISLDLTQCADIVGAPRPAALERYRFAVEQALARANFLNTQSILLLQAALLYISVLRSDDGTRTVWSLIALSSHVARAMGLHRDGTVFKLPPFETEIRRRMWHHLCLLDFRSTEYHGFEPIVADDSVFDTRLPLNINDSDLSPDMTEPPLESEGPTEMTFFHVRCQAMRITWKLKRELRDLSRSRSSFEVLVQHVDEFDSWIRKYVERCDTSDPLQSLAKEIAHIAAARMRTILYYTELVSRKRDVSSADASSTDGSVQAQSDITAIRNHLFTTAIDTLKKSNNVIKDPRLHRWSWHSHTYIQWYTIALVLSEICVRPPSPQCDEAWKYVTAVHNEWLRIKLRNGTERGNYLLKPIGLLMAKAKRVREMQQAEQQTQTQWPRSETGEWMMPGQRVVYETPGRRALLAQRSTTGDSDSVDTTGMCQWSQANPDSTRTPTTPSSDNLTNSEPMYGIADFDPFMEMLPEHMQNGLFESMAQESREPRHDSYEMMSGTPFFYFP